MTSATYANTILKVTEKTPDIEIIAKYHLKNTHNSTDSGRNIILIFTFSRRMASAQSGGLFPEEHRYAAIIINITI